MSAFSAAVDAIFADPNMAVDALYTARGGTAGVACRLIRKRPDEMTDFGGAQIVSTTVLADVRISEIAAPQGGDRIGIGADMFEIQGQPRRDREYLVWTMELVPA